MGRNAYKCRTVEVEGEIYETITTDLIVKAGKE